VHLASGRRTIRDTSGDKQYTLRLVSVLASDCSRYRDVLELTLPACRNLHGRDAQLAPCYFGSVHITPLFLMTSKTPKLGGGRGNALPNFRFAPFLHNFINFSRLFEYCIYFADMGRTHGGLRINRPLFLSYF
jgi:hypothetical protein